MIENEISLVIQNIISFFQSLGNYYEELEN